MKTLTIGLIFAFIGIVLMSGCKVARTTTKQPSIAHATNSWKLTCNNLTAGDTVIFRFLEHALWVAEENTTYSYYDYSDDNPPVAVLRVFIDITPVSPPGNTTRWDYDLAVQNPQTSQGYAAQRLVGWAITKIQNGSIDTSPMLNSNGNLSDVGGIVPFSGIYETKLSVYPPRPIDQPPSYLGFFHNVTVTDYPYTYLLPVGGATVVFGGTASLLGARGIVIRRWKHIRKQRNRTEIK
jgi:hypothetical protein